MSGTEAPSTPRVMQLGGVPVVRKYPLGSVRAALPGRGHHCAAELEATRKRRAHAPGCALPNRDGGITCERPRGRYNGVLLQGEVLKLNDAMSSPITRL